MDERFVPLRWKILGSFLSLMIAVLTASLLLVDWYQGRQTELEIRRQLALTRDVLSSSLALRGRQLSVSLELLAGDFAFKQALATGDGGTIASAAENFRERIGADLVIVADGQGRALADTSGARAPGERARDLPVLARAAEGEAASTIQVLAGRPVLLSAAPLLAAGDVIGVLVAGFRLDEAYALFLKKLTLSDVSFAAGRSLLVSTLGPVERSSLEGALEGLRPGEPRLIGRAPRRQLVLAAPQQGGVTACLQRSWEAALEPLELLKTLLLLVGLAAGAMTVALGFLIAGQVTSPVRLLAAASRRIREGDFAARARIPQRDELGLLGSAFDEMAAGLEERERIRGELERSLLIRMNLAKFVPQRARKLIESDPTADMLEQRETDVTILFADISGYTRISARMQPQKLTAMVERYFSAFLDEIDRRGGELSGTDGDGLMGIFCDGNHAQAAVETAWAIHRAAREFSEREAAEHEPVLMHIGVNSGPALLGATKYEARAGTRLTYTASGMTTNVAARLAAQAEGGDTVVSEETLRRLTLSVPAEDLGERALKNVAKPMRLFRVRA